MNISRYFTNSIQIFLNNRSRHGSCRNGFACSRFLPSRSMICQPRQFSLVKPGKISSRRSVPENINKPSYSASGYVRSPGFSSPEVKSAEQIEKIRHSCNLARKILNSIVREAKVGVTTDELDAFAHEQIIANNAYPSPLNYRNYPKSICTSVNNCACHGIPDDRKLEDGDIVSIDVTVYLNGYHGDCSEAVGVGDVDLQGQRLIKFAKESMEEGISVCGPNIPFSLIGTAIEDKAGSNGFTVVSVFAGHGIGEYFHGPPDIYHFHNEEPGVMLPGMTFTVEPVVCDGDPDVHILDDGWTAITKSNSRTAQFEHTLLITHNGHEVLTANINN